MPFSCAKDRLFEESFPFHQETINLSVARRCWLTDHTTEHWQGCFFFFCPLILLSKLLHNQIFSKGQAVFSRIQTFVLKGKSQAAKQTVKGRIEPRNEHDKVQYSVCISDLILHKKWISSAYFLISLSKCFQEPITQTYGNWITERVRSPGSKSQALSRSHN